MIGSTFTSAPHTKNAPPTGGAFFVCACCRAAAQGTAGLFNRSTSSSGRHFAEPYVPPPGKALPAAGCSVWL